MHACATYVDLRGGRMLQAMRECCQNYHVIDLLLPALKEAVANPLILAASATGKVSRPQLLLLLLPRPPHFSLAKFTRTYPWAGLRPTAVFLHALLFPPHAKCLTIAHHIRLQGEEQR